MRFLLFALLAWNLALSAVAAVPLPRAHSHNDYEHPRPLLEALEHGFCSVEADIHLKDGQLLVAHDPEDVQGDRTLEKLYLEPLRLRVERNGGRVYPGGPSIILLIDIKTEAEPTYAALRQVLERYQNILTRFENTAIATNAVTVILSGNRPRAVLEAEKSRLAAFDGRLGDLGRNLPVSFMPLVSDNWRSHFKWTGEGEFPEEERKKLRTLVTKTHAESRKLRFWAAPDKPEVWRVMYEAGVDLINTDNLSGLAAFLRAKP